MNFSSTTSSSPSLLLSLDMLLAGFGVAVPIWFFFIQSPALMKVLGKEKFVPVMMGLTKVVFRVLFVVVTANALLVGIGAYLSSSSATTTASLLSMLGAWISVLANRFVVVPKALKAGAASAKDRKGDHSRDVKEMAVSGGGKATTKTLHQTVVLFTLLMVGALVAHVVTELKSLSR